MEEECFCKERSHFVREEEYYYQGRMCKECRNEKNNNRIKNLTGIEFAEYLLHRSCIRVLERVRDDKNEVYKGVKCSWDKPLKMKEDLMKQIDFWENWIKQSKIYEESGKTANLRPTIDRIESNVEKGGHYIITNLQVLSHSENTIKAKSIKCKVIFIKNLEVVKITEYESTKDVMKELKIPAYNTINILKDSGKIQCIGNGYSVLIQTLDGRMKNQEFPIYKAVSNKQTILVDYQTGKEYIIKSEQLNFESYGIWFK